MPVPDYKNIQGPALTNGNRHYKIVENSTNSAGVAGKWHVYYDGTKNFMAYPPAGPPKGLEPQVPLGAPAAPAPAPAAASMEQVAQQYLEQNYPNINTSGNERNGWRYKVIAPESRSGVPGELREYISPTGEVSRMFVPEKAAPVAAPQTMEQAATNYVDQNYPNVNNSGNERNGWRYKVIGTESQSGVPGEMREYLAPNGEVSRVFVARPVAQGADGTVSPEVLAGLGLNPSNSNGDRKIGFGSDGNLSEAPKQEIDSSAVPISNGIKGGFSGSATQAAVQTSSSQALGAYTVVPGDSMSEIAQKHGLSLRELKALNPQIANPNLIRPGQKINLGNSADFLESGGVTIPTGSDYSHQVGTTAPAPATNTDGKKGWGLAVPPADILKQLARSGASGKPNKKKPESEGRFPLIGGGEG